MYRSRATWTLVSPRIGGMRPINVARLPRTCVLPPTPAARTRVHLSTRTTNCRRNTSLYAKIRQFPVYNQTERADRLFGFN
ncbi:hypothetical protein PUN28_002850 [Cardiocondyla obscurior]|uniref:Uncharacterized protein n=1 Tax=Cardiocondyla obscurior TaxID=286306 RepID=A0AAW2GWQ0_9HYME